VVADGVKAASIILKYQSQPMLLINLPYSIGIEKGSGSNLQQTASTS
jgi:hypothetical protein